MDEKSEDFYSKVKALKGAIENFSSFPVALTIDGVGVYAELVYTNGFTADFMCAKGDFFDTYDNTEDGYWQPYLHIKSPDGGNVRLLRIPLYYDFEFSEDGRVMELSLADTKFKFTKNF